MKSLAFIVATISGLEVWTPEPLPCTGVNMDALASYLREEGADVLAIRCEYTRAPIESVMPVARPETAK